jgi:hypothetical protein
MIRIPALLPLLLASTAFAHPGHVAGEAGHSHWLALAALAAAVGVAGLGIARRIVARRRARAHG